MQKGSQISSPVSLSSAGKPVWIRRRKGKWSAPPGNWNRIVQPITTQTTEQTNWIRLGKSPKFPVAKARKKVLLYTLGAGVKYCATLQSKVMAKSRWGYFVWGISYCVNRQGGGCHLGHSLPDPLRHWRTALVDYNKWFSVSSGWPTRQARKLATSENIDANTNTQNTHTH